MAFHYVSNIELPAAPIVWVVDDDEDDRLLIRSAFEDLQRPITVLTLSDGDQLLPQLNDCDVLPQLILLDINMVRQNGFETLTQLRNAPAFDSLPVVMLTTSSDVTDRQRSLALGARECLTKPVSYSQLVTLVKSLTDQWELV